jgi:hypothetical protein
MLLPSGEPKIMDFGIATIETARLRLDEPGVFFGTPLYMSPEQALGRDLDGRSDLFSLGAIAYRLLTGRHAFAGASVPAIVKSVITHEPEPPSRLVRPLPPDADYVVARALAKSLDDRYRDGRMLAEDADDVLGGRRPRHRAAWTAPALGGGTASFQSRSAARRELASYVPVLEADAAGAERRTLPRRGRVAAALLAGAAVAWLAWSGSRDAQRPPGPAAAGIAGVAGVAAPLSVQAPRAAAEPARSPEAQPAAASARSSDAASNAVAARLALELEHGLESGRVRLWVDGRLALERTLSSAVTQKLLLLKKRKGRLRETLELAPGSHELKLQVSWDDNVKTRLIRGRFDAGSTRRLAARVGGLRKSLSLDWE